MIPVYGFLEGDTIGLLIMAYPSDTSSDLIHKLQQSAAIRVKPYTNVCLIYRDEPRPSQMTVSDMGMQPLDHFFVIRDILCAVTK